MHTRPIRFFHHGQVHEVQPQASTRTVLQWLREDARCSGTKEGCAEGDCGACTVLVAELADPTNAGPEDPSAVRLGEVRLRPVNACIRLLATLDGRALVTVEDLGTPQALHPAQAALVACHGSQCGFCTPGFAMTLTALHAQHGAHGTRPDAEAVADALAGNLCRCTGYRPIVDAGQRMFDLPGPGLDAHALAAGLRQVQSAEPLELDTPAGRFSAPRRLADLATQVQARPQARLLAGATDIGLWVTKQFRPLPDLISLNEVAELKQMQVLNGELHVGAAVTLEAAFQALHAHWPDLREAWLRFAGPPVRHAGTLGGNVANGSPIGDGAPILMALDARVQLQAGAAVRELPLHAFYLGYMKNALQPGEFLRALVVPLPPQEAGWHWRAWKITKRRDCDISAVFGAFALRLQDDRVLQARLAFGGLAATVQRARAVEAALLGQPWTPATVQAAQAALAAEFQPMSDQRGSAAYRRASAASLLQRLWLETRPVNPLPASATRALAVAPLPVAQALP